MISGHCQWAFLLTSKQKIKPSGNQSVRKEMIIQLHPEPYANSQPSVDGKTLEGGTVLLCEMLAGNLGPDTILVRN